MDKWEDTVMTYEQARARDDETEKQYKKLKGYKGFNWAYTDEDRRTLRTKMEWDKLKKQAEISFKVGQESEVDHSADRCAAYLDASRKEAFKAGEDKGKQEGFDKAINWMIGRIKSLGITNWTAKAQREQLLREGQAFLKGEK